MQAGTVAQGRGEAVNMTCQEQVRRVICGKGDTSYFQQTGTEAAGTGAGAGAGAGQAVARLATLASHCEASGWV